MTKIIFPLRLHMQGPAVAELQDALQLCLDRSALLADESGARTELSGALQREVPLSSTARLQANS
jgi:hypothetical protein